MTNQAKFPDYAFKCEDWKYDETKIPDDKKCLLVMHPKYVFLAPEFVERI